MTAATWPGAFGAPVRPLAFVDMVATWTLGTVAIEALENYLWAIEENLSDGLIAKEPISGSIVVKTAWEWYSLVPDLKEVRGFVIDFLIDMLSMPGAVLVLTSDLPRSYIYALVVDTPLYIIALLCNAPAGFRTLRREVWRTSTGVEDMTLRGKLRDRALVVPSLRGISARLVSFLSAHSIDMMSEGSADEVLRRPDILERVDRVRFTVALLVTLLISVDAWDLAALLKFRVTLLSRGRIARGLLMKPHVADQLIEAAPS